MHDHGPVLDGRVTRWLDEKIRPAATQVLSELDVTIAPVTDTMGDDPVVGQGEPIPIREGLALPYEPFAVGQPWGPAWGTTWMRFRARIPEHARGAHLEAFVDLGGQHDSPGFQCEGLVISPDGAVIKGHNPRNQWIPIDSSRTEVEFYVEAAANPVVLGPLGFRETLLGSKATAGDDPLYELRTADLVLVHDEVRELVDDIEVLRDVAAQLPEDSGRRWEIRRGIDRALDRLDLNDIPGTAGSSREELAPLLARPASPSAHQLVAVGHAHIDSAWLWPLRETRRKVARTIANQLNLLQTHPEHRFVFPAAQHSDWLEQDHPELFERLREAVASGRIIPVGGMWVESDANLPGGEAMCRQLLYGHQYFRRAFDHHCDGVWLPDSFGYSAALPQLARLAGAKWFLTQKISWNQVNDFPHHSFWWEGIDGTRIFTHFPPADTYNSDLGAQNLAHAASNFRDKGRSGISLVPFGYGDGGGGPTREMLARARRIADLDGSPRLELGTPSEFFASAQEQHEAPEVWVGELYLELHRGTFTSVAAVKRGNRRNEHLLREAELWCATAAVRGLMDYPLDRFGELWREVCLHQFHDILPGTCISWVYDEVLAAHDRISDELNRLIDNAQDLLAGDGDEHLQFNASPLALGGIPAMAAASTAAPSTPVRAGREGDGWVLDNGLVRVLVDEWGRVTSLVDAASGRNAIPRGEAGAVLHLHPDFPNQWDAWDIDITAFNTVTTIETDDVELIGDEMLRIGASFRSSRARIELSLRPGDPRLHVHVDVDWQERDALLKLAWPVDVHTDHATSEIEMGHLSRPIHTNTSWDAQRFEVHAHRWVHVGEPGYGVGIANAQTYGWDMTRHARRGGGTYTTVRASLLKGARFPDPRADIGCHHFEFTVRAGSTICDAIADGYAINLPPREGIGSPVEPLVSLDGPVLVEALKLAEDGSGDVIVRLYEPHGSRPTAVLTTSFAAESIVETDLHEDELRPDDPRQQVAPSVILGSGPEGLRLQFRPFQVATLRIRRADR